MLRTLSLGILASLFVVNVGCRAHDRRPPCGPTPPPGAVVMPPNPMPIANMPPQPNNAFLPPGAVVAPPPGAKIVPGPIAPSITPSKEPPQSYLEPKWQPTEAREPPVKVEASRDAPRFQLYAPEPIEKESKKPGPQTTFPAIPQFAVARDNVYAGLRPPLDGLDWLQAKGVQTVVKVRMFGEDDSADRKQVEKRNMRFVVFEVSPQVLTKEKADEFIQLIRTGAKQGIFVYDEDGALAGSMWYLYLRWGEFLDPDAAQLRARQLGLQTNREGTHREMWQAVQKLPGS